MDNISISFATKLYVIYQEAKDIISVKKHMEPFISELFDVYQEPATKYFENRKEYNVKMMVIARAMVDKLTNLALEKNISAEFVMTSSLNADTNLIGDSDIDISMLISDCNDKNAETIGQFLASLGFEYKKLSNPAQQLNCYYSFIMVKNGIEFEIKVRDRIESQLVLQLHKYIEEKSTLVERMAITYGKYIFKNLSLNGTTEAEKLSYCLFKKLVYEMYFAEINGGFMLELHY